MDWTRIIVNALEAAVGLQTVVYALAAIGLNVHFGYTGLLNFGQSGFMAVGAYGLAVDRSAPTAAVLARRGDRPRRRAVVLALLLGIPTLRLRADYLAIVTIAAAEIIRLTVRSVHVRGRVRRHRRPAGLHRRLLRPQPVTRPATTTSAASASTSDELWVLIVGWILVRPVLPRRLPAHAQPVGPGAQGDPRGRGRRAQPRQERLLLQDAEPDHRRRHRLPRRLRLRPRPGSIQPDTSAPTLTFFAYTDPHPRRRGPGRSARSSAR